MPLECLQQCFAVHWLWRRLMAGSSDGSSDDDTSDDDSSDGSSDDSSDDSSSGSENEDDEDDYEVVKKNELKFILTCSF